MPPFSRRALIGTTAAGLAAAAAANAADQPPELLGTVSADRVSLPRLMNPSEAEAGVEFLEPMRRRLGVAVVGLGHLSLLQILPAFGQSRHVRLAALVSGERDKARAVAAQYGVGDNALYDYASFDRLRENPEIDIVYIVLPNAMHAEFTIRAAAAGKHVLCEKPMATNVADAQHMVEACRAADRRLMIAYRCQYEPHHRALVAAVRSNQFGPIKLIEAVNGQNNADNGQWRHNLAMAGGGSLPDVGLYCLTRAATSRARSRWRSPPASRGRGRQPVRRGRGRLLLQPAFPVGRHGQLFERYSLHESRWLRVHMPELWMGLDPAFSYGACRSRPAAGSARATRSNAPAARRQPVRPELDHFAERSRACIRIRRARGVAGPELWPRSTRRRRAAPSSSSPRRPARSIRPRPRSASTREPCWRKRGYGPDEIDALAGEGVT